MLTAEKTSRVFHIPTRWRGIVVAVSHSWRNSQGYILSKVSSNEMGVMMNDNGRVLEKRQLWLNSKHYQYLSGGGRGKPRKTSIRITTNFLWDFERFVPRKHLRKCNSGVEIFHNTINLSGTTDSANICPIRLHDLICFHLHSRITGVLISP